MADLSQYSNEELMKIAGISQADKPDLSSFSNEELFKAAGIDPTEKNVGLREASTSTLKNFVDQLNPFAEGNAPTWFTGKKPVAGERTFLGNVWERPAASMREGIRSTVNGDGFVKGFQEGALNPEKSPTFVQQSQSSNWGRPDQPVRTFLKGFGRDVAAFALDTVTNPADVLLTVLTSGASKGIKIPRSQNIGKAVDKNFVKGVRPSVVGQRTAGQVKQARFNSRLAVDSIVENKANLKFVDDAGEVVTGKLPKSLDEFSQSISQTKKEVFDTYSALKRQAGEEMRVVFVDDIAKELRKSVDNVAINDFAPQAKEAALKLADNLDKRGFYSVDEANDALETLNQQLKAFYRNPDPKLANQNTVNALVANKLRTKLDNVINEETLGKGASEGVKEAFKTLKQRYGALKAIETDVNRRLVVDARKNARGLIDFTDIYTGQQLVDGLLTQNPVSIVKGGASYAAKKTIKFMNDPNRKIANMFKNVYRLKQGIEPIGTQIKKSIPITTRTIERVNKNNAPIPMRSANR